MLSRNSLWILLLLSVLLLAACGGKTEPVTETTPEPVSEAATAETDQTVVSDGLTIDADTLTGEPTFIDLEQDGIAMQIIARRDDAGQVRLAFNTCQACGGSPYAWFENLGDGRLQCQNCKQTFPLDSVGAVDTLGCNPVTITEFTVEGSTVTVPGSLLKANEERFSNWKKFD